MNLHWLNPELAKEYGLESALLFQAIGYWARHNKNKPDRQKDGKSWMYMSREDWLEEFPYIGVGTLRAALEKLAASGLIERGYYSDGMYKRTTWYTLTEKGWELWLIQPKGSANSAKGFGQNSQTITDNTQQATTDSHTPQPPKGECTPKRFQEFWDTWPKHHRKNGRSKCMAIWQRRKLDEQADTILQALEAWKQSWDWKKENGNFIPMPASWLNGEKWENPPAVKPPTTTTVLDDDTPF